MKKLDNHAISEYTDRERYILDIVLVIFCLCCIALFVFAATQQKTPSRIAFPTVLAVVFAMAVTVFAYDNFKHFSVKTTIDPDGLHSTRFGRDLKELPWENIEEVVCAAYTYSGYTACVEERYLVFAGHKLSEKEKKKTPDLAGNINDVIVVRYSEELVDSIRAIHEIEVVHQADE